MEKRDRKGRFLKGKCPNPGGRPKGGGKNLAQQRADMRRELLAEADDNMVKRLGEMVKVLIAKAIDGDVSAAKLVLDRVMPTIRAADPNGQRSLQGITIVVQGVEPRPDIGVLIEQQVASPEVTLT